MDLKDNEYYWLNVTGVEPTDSIMIGQYSYNSYPGGRSRWFISGRFYTAGVGIDVIKRIPKPRLKKETN